MTIGALAVVTQFAFPAVHGVQAASLTPAFAIKPAVPGPIIPLSIYAHGCLQWEKGICVHPPAPLHVHTPNGTGSAADPPSNYPKCQGNPNDVNCSGGDPYNEACDGDESPAGDSGHVYGSGRDSEGIQYWSTACQSNWSFYQDWTQCNEYSNQACDWIKVWEDYASTGQDNRTYWEQNPGVGAYGNLLYGGCGTSSTAAEVHVVDYFNAYDVWDWKSPWVPAGC